MDTLDTTFIDFVVKYTVVSLTLERSGQKAASISIASLTLSGEPKNTWLPCLKPIYLASARRKTYEANVN